eukprot:scaffold4912_cov183-Ochromonas_danica.AAC.5
MAEAFINGLFEQLDHTGFDENPTGRYFSDRYRHPHQLSLALVHGEPPNFDELAPNNGFGPDAINITIPANRLLFRYEGPDLYVCVTRRSLTFLYGIAAPFNGHDVRDPNAGEGGAPQLMLLDANDRQYIGKMRARHEHHLPPYNAR